MDGGSDAGVGGARERLGRALGLVPSGLYILTMGGEGGAGMLCSFVEQAGFEPPMITVAVGAGRPALDALERGAVFGLHILGKGDGPLMKPFLKSAVDPFAGLELAPNAHGVPRLAGALAVLFCRVADRMTAGDHVVVLAEVIDGERQHEGEPMIRVRSDGFGY